MTPEKKSEVTKRLEEIVNRFNTEFHGWKQETGCVASFLWGYPADEKKNLQIRDIHSMGINAIDCIVYRRPAPTAEEMMAVVEGEKS